MGIGTIRIFAFISLIALLINVDAVRAQTKGSTVISSEFGKLPDGTTVNLYTLRNANGVEVKAITYGAIITSILAPDRSGKLADVVLGYDTLDGYLRDGSHFGAVVGRYVNRIAKGRFTLDGVEYVLAINNRPNHLHGGLRGFSKQVWKASTEPSRGASVKFAYSSADGEEGYPGNLNVSVTYTLTDRNELAVEYQATTDKATPINLSQHSYFNLTGATRDVLDHEITLNADRFTPVDSSLIPTGEILPVDGTPFDLRTPSKIGAHINDSDGQIRIGNGYDHNFVIKRQGDGLAPVARVVEPSSGRVLEVTTTEPGVQFYTANTLNTTGKNGVLYQRRFAFCLETQHFPDSPNRPEFPSTILRPGKEFSSKTVFAFGVANK